MAEAVNLIVFGAMTVLFAVISAFLSWYGHKNTRTGKDFLLGKNKTSPMIIALSYGATFLSASAVIGFGGQSAVHGMSLIWLCFLNLFVGLVVAFLVFGKRTRRLGKKVGASTFADLMGKAYDSNGIRVFTAVLIIVMMPIYTAAVLKGGVNSLAVLTGLGEYYNLILLVLSLFVALYVIYGGIIAVMYNDALQAFIMFAGMLAILIVTFLQFGGVVEGTSGLTDLWHAKVGETGLGVMEGFNGWTSTADFGSKEWMTVVSTFLMGVGIGALTQPQLVVRYMSAKSDRDLDKSLIIGSIFMLVVVGSAYTVGSLSNLFFYNECGLTSYQYITSLGMGTDFIVPQYILELFHDFTFGDMFISLFLLSLVCASVSTISALMHTIGAAGGYDIYSVFRKHKGASLDVESVRVNRAFIAVFMVLVVVYCYLMPKDIIAKATSVFMGVTAAALLPAYFHALYSKKPSKKAAIASIACGSVSYMAYGLFMNSGICVFIPICKMLTGSSVLMPDSLLSMVDPLIVSLPISIAVMAIALLIERAVAKTPQACES